MISVSNTKKEVLWHCGILSANTSCHVYAHLNPHIA